MNIGLLGTGNVAKVVGAKLRSLGHEVTLGSRDPENSPAKEWAARHDVEISTLAQTAAVAELVVNTAPGLASLDVLTAAGADNLRGKIVVDVSNGIESRDGVVAVATPGGGSVAEQLQKAFPRARIVKTLNTMAAQVMVDPGRIPGHHTVFLNGDDATAKAEVAELLKAFGWAEDQIIDLGDVVGARATEAALLLFIRLFNTFQTAEFNLSVAKA
ncbi:MULTISPECIES: NADPH-dependent F420 reductase [Pseudofrankia]|uniref:NADPH-dependent F420 reductase n=1 Tax=Pseudofrankia TaxID=2994363 RepID=UPI000234B235|nr:MULTISPECIES: NAD(P)-binding domain-containing protein [Pseudofrankia]OHV38435.1 NADP oxidoreductase [Pseudofrankia sp. EUN1h]